MSTELIHISTMFVGPPATAPGTLTVTSSNLRHQFNITWDEPPLNMFEIVDAYFVNISGPNNLCGNITVNTLQMVTERSYTCSKQTVPQEGDIYTVRVTATTCGQLGPESEPLCLQGKYIHHLSSITWAI